MHLLTSSERHPLHHSEVFPERLFFTTSPHLLRLQSYQPHPNIFVLFQKRSPETQLDQTVALQTSTIETSKFKMQINTLVVAAMCFVGMTAASPIVKRDDVVPVTFHKVGGGLFTIDVTVGNGKIFVGKHSAFVATFCQGPPTDILLTGDIAVIAMVSSDGDAICTVHGTQGCQAVLDPYGVR